MSAMAARRRSRMFLREKVQKPWLEHCSPNQQLSTPKVLGCEKQLLFWNVVQYRFEMSWLAFLCVVFVLVDALASGYCESYVAAASGRSMATAVSSVPSWRSVATEIVCADHSINHLYSSSMLVCMIIGSWSKAFDRDVTQESEREEKWNRCGAIWSIYSLPAPLD